MENNQVDTVIDVLIEVAGQYYECAAGKDALIHAVVGKTVDKKATPSYWQRIRNKLTQ